MKKVAIIHDWLVGMRGGEYVLEALLEIFPDAEVFTLFYERDKVSSTINSKKIHVSSLNKFSLIRRNYKYFLPLLPVEVEKFNLQKFELVISSSHCVAKGIIPSPEALHVSYIHSPMRYIWDQYPYYFGNKKFLKKYYIDKKLNYLRMWDVSSSNRVDYFVANSSYVSKRIKKYYRRDSLIIHPPVEVDYFTPTKNSEKEDFFISVGALVPYKKMELLVRAFSKTDYRLIIVGDGSEYKKLKKFLSSNIKIIKSLSRDKLRDLYRKAKAFVFAGIEDFGISFVEAQAVGLPVIAYGKGGVEDIVVDGKTGLFFYEQSEKGVVEALNKFFDMSFDEGIIRENSLRFSKDKFKEKFFDFIKEIGF